MIIENIKRTKLIAINLFIIIALIFIDQITKNSSMNAVNEIFAKTGGVHAYKQLLPFLNLVHVENRGISFGIFNNMPYISSILLYVVGAISVYIFYLLLKAKNLLQNSTFLLIFSGAVGNLLNRIQYGYVVDFIDFHIKNWHFPAFNLADSYICIGIFLIIFNEILKSKKA